MFAGNGLALFCFLVFWLNFMKTCLCAIPSRATLSCEENAGSRVSRVLFKRWFVDLPVTISVLHPSQGWGEENLGLSGNLKTSLSLPHSTRVKKEWSRSQRPSQ